MNLSLLSKKHKSTILFGLALFFVILMVNFSLAATLETTDVLGNLKTDFAPEELVYIHGYGFNTFSPVQVDVTRPDSVVDSGITISNSSGGFLFVYQLDGIVGDYLIEATDGINSAQLIFTDAAIWTTRNDCGTSQQNVNQYSPGESVYINGDGFNAGNYNWSIKGLPGGASCDNSTIVASGTTAVNASGAFCFNAYTVLSDDCGEYQVKFDVVKGDNYRVVGNTCEDDDECGEESSELICIGNDIYNQTSTPGCVGGSCNITNSSSFVSFCGNVTSSIFCLGNYSVNETTTPSCHEGGCRNETTKARELCENGCSNGQCIEDEPVCGNGIVEQGEECDDGNDIDGDLCSNLCVACESDKDHDLVCDTVDQCPNSKPNEPVDQNGCDIFQFCGQLTCGFNCFEADWRNNEETNHPQDCTVVIPLNNGLEQQPICVPTVATESCAG